MTERRPLEPREGRGPDLQVAERRNLSQHAYEEWRREILAGAPAPGRPIRQDAVAAQLGISKVPLREALGRLHPTGCDREADRDHEGMLGLWLDRPEAAVAEASERHTLRTRCERALELAAVEAPSRPTSPSTEIEPCLLAHAR